MPGVRTVGRLDGTEEKDPITPARIKAWVDNTKKLKDLGFLIPAPLAHQDKNHKFAFPVIVGKDGQTMADAYSGANADIPASWDLAGLNGGYWESFSQDSEGALLGEVDVPNEDTAAKIGTTVKQTSVLVMPGRRVVGQDGAEHEVGEHLAHVSMCLHAQEPGQLNFEPLSAVPASLAMSFILPSVVMDEVSGGAGMSTGDMGLPNPNAPKDPELYAVISLMRSALNVALPEDVTRENFLNSLKLVLTQKLADQRESQKDEGVTERPEDAQTKSPSIAMSQTVTDTKPNTVEMLLMSSLIKNKRKELTDRVAKLVETGRASKKYADEKLYPRISAFAMAAADILPSGDFPKTAIEELLDGLEEATPLVGESLIDQGLGFNDLPLGAETQSIPDDVITGTAVNDLSNDAMDGILDQMNF